MKRAPIAFGAVIVLFVGVYGWFRVEPSVHRWLMVRRGQNVLAQLEAYRQAHGRIPENHCEIGLPCDESGPWYYQTKNQQYLLWFPEGSNSYGYESRTKKWTEDPPPYGQ